MERLADLSAGGDAMGFIFPPSPGFPTMTKPAPAPSAHGNLVGTEVDTSQASTDISMTSPTAQRRSSKTYQVSIDMVCTGAQLETVMGGVAGAGTCVNVKIDPKS